MKTENNLNEEISQGLIVLRTLVPDLKSLILNGVGYVGIRMEIGVRQYAHRSENSP